MFVLGISGLLGHDACACLMKDGEIVAIIEEERLSRRSHSLGQFMPEMAIQECLDIAGITFDEIQYLALSWDKSLMPDRVPVPEPAALFPKNIYHYQKLPSVEYVDHHLSHAASAFYFSGYNESSILVVDGAGEDCSTSLYVGKDQKITRLKSKHYIESLGEFYALATAYLGFSIHDAGKTMGLAPYGKPRFSIDRIQLDDAEGYKIDIAHDKKMEYLRLVYSRDFLKMGLEPPPIYKKATPFNYKWFLDPEFDQVHLDFAASVQKILENCYINTAKVLIEMTGCRNLCLAGGVALNCTANGKLRNTGMIDNLFIQPAANDAGTAIGAAAYVMAELGYPITPIINAYGGRKYTNDQIVETLNSLGISYEAADDVVNRTSEYLAQGYTVGWFQGASEYGPRALGNRSILADPSKPGIRDYVNHVVKLREAFRPFGPSILESEVPAWFENIQRSPFMLQAFQARTSKAELIKGAIHVDGSSRPQTVTEQSNRRYYQLLRQFQKNSGLPLVLNTSFNLRGEPMVYSPYDAIRTFFTSALDVLVMEDIIVKKDRQKD